MQVLPGIRDEVIEWGNLFFQVDYTLHPYERLMGYVNVRKSCHLRTLDNAYGGREDLKREGDAIVWEGILSGLYWHICSDSVENSFSFFFMMGMRLDLCLN